MNETKAKKKVLIISHDKIGSSMAGPGIRYHYMAQTLCADFDVTVGFFDPSYLPEEDFAHSYKARHIDAHSFEPGFEGFEIIISHWLSETMLHYCNTHSIFVVIDLYVPGPVENLASTIYGGKAIKYENDFEYNRALTMYKKFFENGDLFLFSNERQLDYWTGYAFGSDQIHLSTYQERPIYDRFIYAPMGIDTNQAIKHTKDVIKGVVPGIDRHDKVLLWTGGIWNHFDGQVLIKAMGKLKNKRPDIKLFFIGTQHPNPNVPEMKESFDTRKLATKLGLIDRTVFFNDGWVKYSERINYLLEADVAVNTHKSSIETEFSHRTRVLDHLLAGLPTISTKGDYLTDAVIGPKGLGVVVPPNDESSLADAIISILEPDKSSDIKKTIALEREAFDWEKTMSDLTQFLSGDIHKLALLSSAPKVHKISKTRRVVKKVLPVPIKKAIIRTLRMK
ncbi:MAG: glycosyltransferase family 4 protein [Candidatus Levybacteria bacterium]|nr:glycosyltransferase family 4 protein [Candidatus Levybacteria bacterium]